MRSAHPQEANALPMRSGFVYLARAIIGAWKNHCTLIPPRGPRLTGLPPKIIRRAALSCAMPSRMTSGGGPDRRQPSGQMSGLSHPCGRYLADDLAYARRWDDLQARLCGKCYRFAGAGSGLILEATAIGAGVCKASEPGYSYSALLRRFGRVFSGHADAAPLRRIHGH